MGGEGGVKGRDGGSYAEVKETEIDLRGKTA